MSEAVFCIVPTEERASTIVDALKLAGFQTKDVSALLPDAYGSQNVAYNNNTKAAEGISTGTGTGAMLGGALGWLTGIGALAIPGLGAFIAAGPIMALLSGAAIGGGVGGLVGGLLGWGIPEYEAKRYETDLREGNILLSVHTRTSDEAKKAEAIFKDLGAHDIKRSIEARTTTNVR